MALCRRHHYGGGGGGGVQAVRMLCTGEPKAFIIETEGFKALVCENAHSGFSVAIFSSGPVSRSVLESQA